MFALGSPTRWMVLGDVSGLPRALSLAKVKSLPRHGGRDPISALNTLRLTLGSAASLPLYASWNHPTPQPEVRPLSKFDAEIHESFLGFEIALPSGQTIHCKPLVVKEFVYFHALLQRAQGGDEMAYIKLIEEFPAAIGHPDLVETITPGEVVALFPLFFTLARTFPQATNSDQARTTHTHPTEGSPTSGQTSPHGTDTPPSPMTAGTSRAHS